MYYVYVLLCSDGAYYTGYTADIHKRINEHKDGLSFSTSHRLPIKIEWIGIFKNKYKALEFEKYLKSGSGKAFFKKHLL